MSKTDFCRECHKKLNMRNEKMILGRIRCEKAPQVVPACVNSEWIWDLSDDNVVDVSTEMKILMRYERIINTLESCVHSSCDIVLYHDILGGHYSDDNCILYCAT